MQSQEKAPEKTGREPGREEPLDEAKGKATESPTPRADVVRIELDYKVTEQKLEMRSKAPTIMIEGIFGDALAVLARGQATYAPLPADNVVRLVLEYDLERGELVTFDFQAPRVVILGILMHSLGAITRNQMGQNVGMLLAKFESRVGLLEAQSAKMGAGKLIIPGHG